MYRDASKYMVTSDGTGKCRPHKRIHKPQNFLRSQSTTGRQPIASKTAAAAAALPMPPFYYNFENGGWCDSGPPPAPPLSLRCPAATDFTAAAASAPMASPTSPACRAAPLQVTTFQPIPHTMIPGVD